MAPCRISCSATRRALCAAILQGTRQKFHREARRRVRPCMLKPVMAHVPIGTGLVSSGSAASRRDQTGRREIEKASAQQAVTERDPRRPRGNSPDSRRSRQRTTRSSSSHRQDWEFAMTDALYVGLDVAKDSFDVASDPAGLKLSLPNDPKGRQKLLDALQTHRVALIVLEATGGYERRLA